MTSVSYNLLYAVEREVDDLAAVIAVVGGSAAVAEFFADQTA
jgi:hypothetical protein